ncbi:MAG: ferredoxin [Patescibacteria group bacterium]
MAKYKITQDIAKCLGCGACGSICDNWTPNNDGKYEPKETEIDEKGCNQAAAENCPVQCIKIEEIN